MDRKVVLAIQEKTILNLIYPGYSRTVEPHAYGLDRHGEALLLCFQTAASRREAGDAGWKCLRLKEASSVSGTAQRFSRPQSGYIRNNPVLHTIFAQI
jgi:hypothetical protein